MQVFLKGLSENLNIGRFALDKNWCFWSNIEEVPLSDQRESTFLLAIIRLLICWVFMVYLIFISVYIQQHICLYCRRIIIIWRCYGSSTSIGRCILLFSIRCFHLALGFWFFHWGSRILPVNLKWAWGSEDAVKLNQMGFKVH